MRWLLALVLVWAGLSKLADPVAVYGAMLEYRLPLPAPILKAAAIILPWLELFCGLLLVTGFARQAVLLLVTALFTAFLLIVGHAVFRGLDINCGCFNLEALGLDASSSISRALESITFALFRNALLWLAAAALLVSALRSNAPQTSDSPVSP